MRGLALVLTLVAAVAVGCGDEAGDGPSTAPSRVTAPSEDGAPVATQAPRPARCEAGAKRSYAEHGVAAVLLRPTVAFRSPGKLAVASFEKLNDNGVPMTFRVLEARLGADCRPNWYRVQLPVRPNGTEAWIHANTVRRYAVDFRIVVDLSERQITVYRDGDVVVRTRTAIGRPETPTPTGSFYVNQRLLAADPTGPWGPGGIGISAFSPTLVNWPQGGPIAIHGTNRPESIGQVTSNGCLRIDNVVLKRLIHTVPEGTPVRIRV